ncbi:hypothetical protein JCM10914A_53620 [Paenibacillus sp. JCM 10914]|uniref:hypothetical protein n=1 Tax=Paenibacillus sp. JCM 10914 TaxID=1236974 RepID=UPI0003CCB655|nr:hypothetical protein [Paenibacillus sp. JCM 10914]GAE04910.1 putative ESAT-secreted protein, BA2188 homolog [Paenibacillus sp. JCM 10914]
MKRECPSRIVARSLRKSKSEASAYYYESKQTADEPVMTISDAFTCRYAYGRAAESVRLSEKGQDYVAFSMDEDICHFVLCDGVGLSYRGDIASRMLGQGLMKWLDTRQDLTSVSLERKLQNLTLTTNRELSELTLDSATPKLLREVLEEKQRLGSEAMYICGRIILPSRTHRKGQIWLAWQGDSRVRLWHQQQELTSVFGDGFRTAERWSSRRGPIGGKPHVYQGSLEADDGYRLQVYSDGLIDLDPVKEPIPDEQVQLLLNAQHTGGLEDDASFLEIMW